MKLSSYSVENNELCLRTGSGDFVPVSGLLEGGYQRPTYIYNFDDVKARLEHMKQAFKGKCHIHYALKSNDHPVLLKKIAELGVGVDLVSAGELRKALESGFKAKDIVFSGVGKTKAEIKEALQADIAQLNVESPAELKRIEQVASELSVKAKVAFRLNPEVNPVTHPYICTGFRENKFGMDSSFFDELHGILNDSKHLELVGVTAHIGSQLRDLSASIEAVEKSLQTFEKWRSKGFAVKTLDIGGGIGIDYSSLDTTSEYEMIEEYGAEVLKIIEGHDLELLSEPGRIIVGRCGVLVSEVQYIKETPHKNFCIVDTGMHQLMRPSLYQANHQILPLKASETSSKVLYDIVGPICESADVIGHERPFQPLFEGDLLAIMDAGAYGRVMMSDYNSHAKPLEIVVENGKIVS
ncbi:MAG: diaminopimelate decarboxylase [Bdellovibrionales bacterium]|nr:diaminopimelate decarboxylase [Bdellovibrionales bacterium]